MIERWFYVIPLIFFGVIFRESLKQYKSSKKSNVLPILVSSLYLLSAGLIFFVEPEVWYPYFDTESYNFINFTLYSVLLFICLLPSLNLKPLSIQNYFFISSKSSYLMIGMAILGIYSFVYQLPYAFKGLAIGSSTLRLMMNNEGYFLLPKSPLTTLAVGVSYFYIFYIYFFFVSILKNGNKKVRIGLLIGSLSYVVSGLSFATRDVFIFYTLGFVFIYFYFKPLLGERRKLAKLLLRFAGIISVIGVLVFSVQRFAHRYESYSFAYGTVGYIAQQPFVFSQTVNKQTQFYEGNLRFPLFKSFFGQTKDVKRTEHYEWMFGTFIKDFYSAGGLLFLIIMTLLFFFFFQYHIGHRKGQTKVYNKVILDLFYFQFMTMGVFYFNFGNSAGNIYILVLVCLYFFNLLVYKKKGRLMKYSINV